MIKVDARPNVAGTLPGYLSLSEAAKFAGRPIGSKRKLSMFEEADMLAAGLDREKIADMTPDALKRLADLAVNQSNLFLGS
jgi:hypothetical protein